MKVNARECTGKKIKQARKKEATDRFFRLAAPVVSQCALKFQEQVEKAKKAGKVVPHGTLKDIIKEEEEKNGLEVNSISFETVRSRVRRGNILGYNPQQSSPMHDIEPLIFEFCVRLAKMGKPLTKTTVIELANSLVSGTEYESKISDCKNLRKLNQSQKLGSAWYKGFLKCYSDDLSRSGSVIKDIKQRTWVTHDNFENMYENVYKTMVEAGIAKESQGINTT